MNDLALEKENKLKAWLITIVSYSAFLALLYFIKLKYEPKPEQIAMGVDLNYGIDLVGYGTIQTTNKASDSKIEEEMMPSGSEVEKPEPTPSTPKKAVQPPASKPKAAAPIISSEKSDTKVVAPKKTTAKKTTTTTPKKTTTSTKTTSSAPATKAKAPAKKVDTGSLYKKGSSSSNGTTGTKEGIGGNNNGDGKPGDVGDQGDPRGTLDGKSLYGDPGKGGSGGASISISGWNKRKITLPTDNTNETGKIVFKVTVDDTGDVIGISTVESSVSPSVTNFYKSYLKNKLGSYLSPEGTPPPRASGTITILITRAN